MTNSDFIEVPLTRGHVAVVDTADGKVLQWKWRAQTDGWNVYAERSARREGGSYSRIRLHRFLLGPECVGLHVDHIDGDTLNNRRSNLRAVPAVRNHRNLGGAHATNTTSGVMGVSKNREGHWAAFIRDGGANIYLGCYSTLEAAAVARAREELRRWGVEPRRERELSHWLALEIDPKDFRIERPEPKSGVPGVYRSTCSDRWVATIRADGKARHLGCFKTKEDAVSARLSAEASMAPRKAPQPEERLA